MQACPRCQTENRDDARICTKCDASLERTTFGRAVTVPGQGAAAGGSESPSSMRTCPSCGQAAPATTQFCSACGKAFDGRVLAGVEYASFGRRLAGYLIDVGILLVIDVISVFIIATVWSNLFSIVISFGYVVLLNANGGTLGKRMLDMRLQNRETGENIGIGMAVIRYFVALVSGLAILIGYLWSIWDPNKQTWHDKAAGSVVVKT
ncbi:MAG: RDD family protein [Chloroflexi bacterium]|nr:RDD family protein [Chloroflexota bacterium]